MKGERDRVLGDFATNPDRDYRELFTTPETQVNAALAKHYGLPGPATNADWTRVERAADGPRLGLLGMAGLLTATSSATRTSTGSAAREDYETVNKAMSDLLALPLACDITRVFSYQWSGAEPFNIFWMAGTSAEHHPMSHEGLAYNTVQPRITKAAMNNLGYLLGKLKAINEGPGNLLDRTLI